MKKLDKSLKKGILKDPNVVSIGQTKDGIEVEVWKGKSNLVSLPDKIEGKKVYIIEIEKEEEDLSHFDPPTIYHEKHRPLRPGTILRGERTGSTGFFFEYNDENYLMTAYHLLEDLHNPQKGIEFYQSYIYNRDKDLPVATLHSWPDLYTDDPGAGDAMILKMENNHGGINELLENNIQATKVVEPKLGMEVIKAGTTTQEVKGVIDKVDVTMKRGGGCFTEGQTWENMFRNTCYSEPGDSGGLVISKNGEVLGITCTTLHAASVVDMLKVAGFPENPKVNITREHNELTLWLNKTTYVLNDDEGELDVSPYLDENSNRALAPLRFIGESFGAQVDWLDGGDVYIKLNDKEINMKIDNKIVNINGQKYELDVAPMIINNRTLVPLRFISEALGFEVNYYHDEKKIEIKG